MISTLTDCEALTTKLRTVGMDAFVHLYPALRRNPNVTLQEICASYDDFNKLKATSQNTKLSTARSIFRKGWEIDALKMIAESSNAHEASIIAKKYLSDIVTSVSTDDNLKTHTSINSTRNAQIDTALTDTNALGSKLRTIGMDSFVRYLYPAFKNNPNVTLQEICAMYDDYNNFKVTSQLTKFSNARSIFRKGWEIDALKMIAESSNAHEASIIANNYLNNQKSSLVDNNEDYINKTNTTINSSKNHLYTPSAPLKQLSSLQTQKLNSENRPLHVKSHENESRPSSYIFSQHDIPKAQSIHIEEGQTGISYKSLFADYLIGATEIVIEDPYIRQTHQIYNLRDFLSMIIALCKEKGTIYPTVRFHTWYSNPKQHYEFKETLIKIKKETDSLGLVFTYGFRQFHDRCIRTNTGWNIALGRGLDIYLPYDKFSIIYQQQENRPCKEFNIHYSKE